MYFVFYNAGPPGNWPSCIFFG